jgi:hypothetical protein
MRKYNIIRSTIFWDVTPCSPAEIYRHFGVTSVNFHRRRTPEHEYSQLWEPQTQHILSVLYNVIIRYMHRLCGLVVRVPGYTSRGPGFNSRRYQIFWEVVGLERGPLSRVIIEELLERKAAAPG